VVNFAIINIINVIWFARNQFRFSNKKIPWKSSISSITALVSLASNDSKTYSISMADFSLLKKFDIIFHPPRAPRILEGLWHPLLTLGSNVVQMDMLMGIFRNANADMLLCFAKNIGIGNAFQAELIGAMRAIEIAHQKCWNYLWLEQDLSMVVYALQAKIQVPCDLRN
jgi:hypothetical protein